MTDIINVPLNKLAAWDGNVRKTRNKAGLDELAASIKAHGLLQSLVVRKDGGKFAVVAGSRRLAAIASLVKSGDIKPGFEVPCQVIENDADATEISLAENAVREQMHPADECDAYRDLIDKGAPVADVAARFGKTETYVRQRLKLARVSPAVIAAYRKGELNLEQVQAFAVSDDHEAQEQVLSELSPYDLEDPGSIRGALTANDIAATDRRVRYVTLKSYEKAGGAVRRDLFSQDDRGVFLLDAALLDRLVAEKLDRAAKTIAREGWKWVEVLAEFDYQEKSKYQIRRPEPVPLPAKKQAELEALQKEYDALDAQWAESGEEDTPARLDEIGARIDKLNDRDEAWTPETLAIAGAVVSVGYDGKAAIVRGLVRPEDAPRKTAKQNSSAPDEAGQGADDQPPAFSAALLESLTAHKSAALSAELMQRPDIALAAVVHALASSILLGGRAGRNCLQIIPEQQYFKLAEGSIALRQIEAARETWGQTAAGQEDALWQWCLEQHKDVLLDLLAFCTACTIDAVQRKADKPDSQRLCHAGQLASAVSLDMKAWFTPTAENYFSRIGKPQILAALTEARNQPPAPAWEKLKKSELAALAEREINGTGWLPAILRRQ